MDLYPAVDLLGGKAVRLMRGDYEQVTVYGAYPEETALTMRDKGASHIHIVDLDGARTGETPNFETVKAIKAATGLFCEVGGGVRSMDVIERYLAAGLDRVIVGTAAVKDTAFLMEAAAEYGHRLAVGADIRGDYLAVEGWTETTEETVADFLKRILGYGVRTVICTDISKDGVLAGPNAALYRKILSEVRGTGMALIASGGVTRLQDLFTLRDAGLSGAIIGKAYYTGAIDLRQAVRLCEG
ncbi:MAG: 1-(5-phosphoribosyl)-5-[(5-phosphoribosylamino)methylideneamino]imidazole-4-carboxamide isomerase [Lachnospiraceae bacterium]|nr:1-(5-phosphoribosyl)-5-[(5-phosphoribosylamino)methylideneamino]imidazole-4-carboxamide isomerase [Lachnospiraceae bacterium]